MQKLEALAWCTGAHGDNFLCSGSLRCCEQNYATMIQMFHTLCHVDVLRLRVSLIRRKDWNLFFLNKGL